MKHIKTVLLAMLAVFLPSLVMAGQADLAWTPPPVVTGYVVNYGTVKGGPYPSKITVSGIGTLQANISGLTSGQQVCFVMRNVFGSTESPVAGPEGCGNADTNGSFTVSWTSSAVVGFSILYGNTKGGPYPEKKDVGVVTTANVANIANGKETCFVVRTRTETRESGNSNEACATVPLVQTDAVPGAATGLSVTVKP